jgi:predicted transcriptional regulator
MIICSREEANKLIQDNRNLFSKDERNKDIVDYEVKEIKHGRGAGVENLSPEMRKIIAEEALISGKTQAEVAIEYGVSPQAVEAYVKGATSLATYNTPNEELAPHITQVKDQIKTQAQNALLTAIQSLTDDKISGAKAKDIAGIAKDMSSVLRNIEPQTSGPVINNKVLVYSPRVKEEDDYAVIEARE